MIIFMNKWRLLEQKAFNSTTHGEDS